MSVQSESGNMRFQTIAGADVQAAAAASAGTRAAAGCWSGAGRGRALACRAGTSAACRGAGGRPGTGAVGRPYRVDNCQHKRRKAQSIQALLGGSRRMATAGPLGAAAGKDPPLAAAGAGLRRPLPPPPPLSLACPEGVVGAEGTWTWP